MIRSPSTTGWPVSALLAVALGMGLVGCGSSPTTVTKAPAPEPAKTAAVPRDVRNDAIAVEQRWLLSYFSGTPVEIARADDGALTIAVPAEFCFHPNSAVIKPPLAKVLEKVGQSLRRRSLLMVSSVDAPPDAKANPRLAVKRAQAVQRRLRSYGIDRRRFGTAGATSDAVRLRLQWGTSPD